MSPSAMPMTAAQYFDWSTEGDRTQLVEGEVIVNEPKPRHGQLIFRVAFALQRWIEAGDGRGLVLPAIDVVMNDLNVFAPDVNWIAERNRPADMDQRVQRVPDICVEVRSPGTWRYDIGAKMRVYERGGLPELWLVDDVADTVFIFRRSKPEQSDFDVALELRPGDTLASPQLPDFELGIDRLLAKG